MRRISREIILLGPTDIIISTTVKLGASVIHWMRSRKSSSVSRESHDQGGRSVTARARHAQLVVNLAGSNAPIQAPDAERQAYLDVFGCGAAWRPVRVEVA